MTNLTTASTTSVLNVQIEKFEGPDDWPKWKWQILILLRAHCLEGITDLESALSCLRRTGSAEKGTNRVATG